MKPFLKPSFSSQMTFKQVLCDYESRIMLPSCTKNRANDILTKNHKP